MAEAWPTDVPESPLLMDYSSVRQSTKLRTTVEAGLDKIRNRYRAAPVSVSETFHFQNTEKESFQTFHDDTCKGGTERFIRENPEDGLDTEYRFVSEPDYQVIGYGNGGAIWRVSLEIEIIPA